MGILGHLAIQRKEGVPSVLRHHLFCPARAMVGVQYGCRTPQESRRFKECACWVSLFGVKGKRGPPSREWKVVVMLAKTGVPLFLRIGLDQRKARAACPRNHCRSNELFTRGLYNHYLLELAR
jgi:hypothetical protein